MRVNNQPSEDYATKMMGEYVRDKGISVLAMSKSTGIKYDRLRRSLKVGERALRTDEFLTSCLFLEVDPMKFKKPDKPQSGIPPDKVKEVS